MGKWIAVDFDATLAEYYPGQGVASCGAPIPEMVRRVKLWLSQGREVRILTARVFVPRAIYGQSLVEGVGHSSLQDYIDDSNHQREMIQAWCLEHLGQKLAVQCEKDYDMAELWDDRAIGIWPNTGVPATDIAYQLKRELAIERIADLLLHAPAVTSAAEWHAMIVDAVLDAK